MWLLLNVLILKCLASKREKRGNENENEKKGKSRFCFFKFLGSHFSQWMSLVTMVAHPCVCKNQ